MRTHLRCKRWPGPKAMLSVLGLGKVLEYHLEPGGKPSEDFMAGRYVI